MLVIWVLGSAIIWRLRAFISVRPMSCRFSRSLSCAAGSRAIPGSRKFRPSPGPMYQLFIFFHDHRSKDDGALEDWASAWSRSAWRVSRWCLRLHQSVYAPFYALFLVGPTAMLIEMWMDSRVVQPLRCMDRACLKRT